jgi:hypothetical protein
LNVVHTQRSSSGSHVKLPGATSGNTSGSVRSYASGRAVGERQGPREHRLLARARCARPRVLARDVVEHDVDGQRHPVRQGAQVVHVPSAGSTAP